MMGPAARFRGLGPRAALPYWTSHLVGACRSMLKQNRGRVKISEVGHRVDPGCLFMLIRARGARHERVEEDRDNIR